MNRLTPILLVLAGCPEPAKDETILLSDANNYSYAADITIGTISTAIRSDIAAYWDNLTTDIQGHDVTSCDDIDGLQLIWFQYLTLDELSDKIICGDVRAADADVAVIQDPEEPEPSDCTTSFSELSISNNAFDPVQYYAYDTGVWLSQVVSGTTNTRMLTALAPSEEGTATSFSFENDSSTLAFEARLQDAEPVTVPARALSYTIDWSNLVDGANADGCPPTEVFKADTLWIAHYTDLTVSDLEEQFLDLELVADGIWTGNAGAVTSVPLNEVLDESGAPLEGFTTDGVWLVALRCTSCTSPAPVYLAVLNVE